MKISGLKRCWLRKEGVYRKIFLLDFCAFLIAFSEPGRHGPVFFCDPQLEIAAQHDYCWAAALAMSTATRHLPSLSFFQTVA
jgi:hypothetical protein